MAITIGNHTIAGSSNSNNVTTSAIDTTGASLLSVAVACDDFGGDAALTDSAGNTWTPRTEQADFFATSVQMFDCANPVTSATHTFSSSDTGSKPTIAAVAVNGSATSTPHDQQSGNHTNSSSAVTIQPGSVTPSEDNEILLTCVAWNADGSPVSINSSFTELDELDGNSNRQGLCFAYKIQTSAGAENPTWTLSASRSLATSMQTYKAAAAGGANPKGPLGNPFVGPFGGPI